MLRTLSMARLLVFAILAGTCSMIAAARPQQPSAAKSSSNSASSSSSSAKTKSTSKKKKSSKRRSAKREPFQKAPTPERISEIQSALARGGYYQGTANGKWDADTVGALEKFQSDNGMNPSGKIDALSLQKLGLGSSTAGVDAPKPLSHPSPRATLTSSTASAAGISASAANTSASTVPASASSSASAAKPPQR
ncbi:MAG: peptidoglycan-binding domain-containing protein [Candidatus Acidiferrales bacterium]